jgi:LysR family cyn operon transcriptional activator
MNISIENLKHFEILASIQNINQTAIRLAISPSAISFSLSKIEAEVGEKLFNRVGKRIFLNSAGRDFLDQTKKVLGEFSNLSTFKNSETKFKGHLRMGASHWLASKVLPHACMKINQEHSDLLCEVRSMDTFRLTNDLLTGQLDFAMSFSIDPHPEVIQESVYDGGLKIVVSKHHPLAKLPPKEWLKEINRYPHVAHKSGKLIERCDDHPMFAKFGIQPKISFLWDNDEVGLELLRISDAWTLMPDLITEKSKEFCALSLPKGWEAPYSISLLYCTMTTQQDVIKKFGDEIRDHLKG